MKTKCLVSLLFLLLLVGCEEDENEHPIVTEVFSGELTVEDVNVPESKRTDTIVFTVEDGLYYLDHVTHLTNLCNSGGEISAFGKPVVDLKPTYTLSGNNCDTIRIPQGRFEADFKDDNDSLIMVRRHHVVSWEHEGQQQADTLDFTFLLSKQESSSK